MVRADLKPEAIQKGMDAGRSVLDNYSVFYSRMVSDDALRAFVTAILEAVYKPTKES